MPHTRTRFLFFIVPSAVLIAALLYEFIAIYTAPEGKIIRLLTSSPHDMELRTPLREYRVENFPWVVKELEPGWTSYEWEGIPFMDPDNPFIEIRQGEERLPKYPGWESIPEGESGFTVDPGDERVLVGKTFFHDDHTQYYSGNIPWDSPILHWESRPITNDTTRIELIVSLDNVFLPPGQFLTVAGPMTAFMQREWR